MLGRHPRADFDSHLCSLSLIIHSLTVLLRHWLSVKLQIFVPNSYNTYQTVAYLTTLTELPQCFASRVLSYRVLVSTRVQNFYTGASQSHTFLLDLKSIDYEFQFKVLISASMPRKP